MSLRTRQIGRSCSWWSGTYLASRSDQTFVSDDKRNEQRPKNNRVTKPKWPLNTNPPSSLLIPLSSHSFTLYRPLILPSPPPRRPLHSPLLHSLLIPRSSPLVPPSNPSSFPRAFLIFPSFPPHSPLIYPRPPSSTLIPPWSLPHLPLIPPSSPPHSPLIYLISPHPSHPPFYDQSPMTWIWFERTNGRGRRHEQTRKLKGKREGE